MPAQRLSMRQVREVLRLKWACGLSDRKIAHSLRVSRPTVAEYVRRAQAAGLSWPLPDALDETALERRLFATATKTPVARRPTPDWSMFGIQVYAMHGIYIFISTTKLCQAIAFSPYIYLINNSY